MKIDVRQKLLNYKGEPIEEGENKTFRDFLTIGLNNVLPTETLTGEQKAKIYTITTKLYERRNVTLTLDERAFAKERVEKTLPPMHAGRIVDVLEERTAPPILPDGAEDDGVGSTENSDNANVETKDSATSSRSKAKAKA